MSFVHSSGFAYIKNLIIGLGAAVVLVGALFKIQSWPYASEMLTVGLLTEAGLFIMLGVLPPHKEYYWEKLYPGLDTYGGHVDGAGAGTGGSSNGIGDIAEALKGVKLDTAPLEKQQQVMVAELQTMAKSMSSLKALQEADFSSIKDITSGAGKFTQALNNAVTSIAESLEDTKVYREQLADLNKNMKALNSVYGGVLAAMKG